MPPAPWVERGRRRGGITSEGVVTVTEAFVAGGVGVAEDAGKEARGGVEEDGGGEFAAGEDVVADGEFAGAKLSAPRSSTPS